MVGQRPARILEVNGTEASDQGRRVIVGVHPGDIAEDTGNAFIERKVVSRE